VDAPIDRLRWVEERIQRAAGAAGRDPKDITLVAVTKTVPLDRILPFLQAGIRHVGENRVQEALLKYTRNCFSPSSPPVVGGGSMDPLPEAAGDDVTGSIRQTFHLIGPLQSNKAKKAVAFFDMIQSLDRWDLAEDVDRHAGALGKVQDCLIEVKVSEEPNKSGLAPEMLPELLERLVSLRHLRIRGLMGIPPLSASGDAVRPYFQRLHRLFEESRLEILSMGMSSDFEAAIAEGSTMVRLGTVLFGSRQ
jgi:uncharacterized pyridoxal phosphate-containing UPF0001 family protein